MIFLLELLFRFGGNEGLGIAAGLTLGRDLIDEGIRGVFLNSFRCGFRLFRQLGGLRLVQKRTD